MRTPRSHAKHMQELRQELRRRTYEHGSEAMWATFFLKIRNNVFITAALP